jgi:hypothetical protein
MALIGSRLVRYPFSVQRRTEVGASDMRVLHLAGSASRVGPRASLVHGGTGPAFEEEESDGEEGGLMNERMRERRDQCAGRCDLEKDMDPLARGCAGDEHDNNEDGAKEGRRSGSADVDMGVGAGNEHGTTQNVGEDGERPSSPDVDMGAGPGSEHGTTQNVGEDAERPSSPDVDMGAGPGSEHGTTQNVGEDGERPSSADVDMGAGPGKDDDNNQDGGSPKSNHRKKLPTVARIQSAEKRQNPTREAKSKRKHEPPPPPPRPRPKPIRRLKPKQQAQSINLAQRNYFEEIELGGVSRMVDMIDLTQDIVSDLSLYTHIMC